MPPFQLLPSHKVQVCVHQSIFFFFYLKAASVSYARRVMLILVSSMMSSRRNRLMGMRGVTRPCVRKCLYLIECSLSGTRASIRITNCALRVHIRC